MGKKFTKECICIHSFLESKSRFAADYTFYVSSNAGDAFSDPTLRYVYGLHQKACFFYREVGNFEF